MSKQDDELTPQDWDELIEAAYIERIPSAAIRNKVVKMQKIVEKFSPTLADWRRHGKLAEELAWLVPTLLDENAQLRAERDRLLARCAAHDGDLGTKPSRNG